MDAAELIEPLESINPADLDREIRHSKERTKRLEQLRKLISGGFGKAPRATGDGSARAAGTVTELSTQIITTLEALGPSKAGTIAAQLGCSPQAVGMALSRIPGAEQNDEKYWSLPSQRKRGEW